MRDTWVELAWAAAALALTLLLTWGAAWSYPAGRAVIWTTGAVGVVTVIAINVGKVRAALARDRARTSGAARDRAA